MIYLSSLARMNNLNKATQFWHGHTEKQWEMMNTLFFQGSLQHFQRI